MESNYFSTKALKGISPFNSPINGGRQWSSTNANVCATSAHTIFSGIGNASL